jgi:epoxyqueuosine reductase
LSLKKELIDLVVKSVNESEHRDLFREPLVGFSSATDPLYKQLKEIIGPEHLYPQDILPEAKTVVSFFIPFSEKVVASNRKQEAVSMEWAESYVEANKLINEISSKMVEYLEGRGISAATVKATYNYDEKTLKCGWSHRSAAYIAGLGKFGVNRMLITRVGCAGRYGSVIVSHEITPDKRTDEEFCVYHKKGTCLNCIKACPVAALDLEGFDKFKCNDWVLENGELFKELGACDVCGKCVVAGPCAIISSRKAI